MTVVNDGDGSLFPVVLMKNDDDERQFCFVLFVSGFGFLWGV